MKNKSYLYALSTVFIWASLASVSKLLLSEIPSFQTNCICGLLAAIFMLLLNIFTHKMSLMKQYKPIDYLRMFGLGFIGMFLYHVLYFYALTILTAQEACILNYLWPIMIVVFSCIILKEKLTAKKSIALICSFIGIVVLSLGSDSVSSGNKLLGALASVGAAVFYGLFSVLNKKYQYDQGIAMMIMWTCVAICSLVGNLFETWVSISALQLVGFCWLGFIVDGFAYYAWALALNEADNTASIANLAYLTPFLSICISALILNETITLRAILSLVFIVGGILIQSINFKNK